MAFAAGDQLGPYEIIAPLGEGGMASVYRARQPRRRLLVLGGGAVVVAGAAGAALLLTRGGSSNGSGGAGAGAGSGPTVETLAGSPERGAGFTDGPASQAQFDGPYGLAIDATGAILLADQNNQRIRKIAPNGTVSTVAGSGMPGRQNGGFVDGAAGAARFNQPAGVAVDAAGAIFVADSLNHRIRKLAPDGSVSTLAGGVAGLGEGRGLAARFSSPMDVAVDGAGTLYVADFNGHRIRKIAPDGSVSTLAGSGGVGPNAGGFADGPGAQAQFNQPAGLAVDSEGTVYVADSGNHRIRKIAPNGQVSTLGGGQRGLVNGPARQARFSSPWRIAFGPGGALYVADSGNAVIRRIAPDGTVSTLAGSGASGTNNGPAGSARFSGPRGLAVSGDGTVYVADFGNNLLRKIVTR